MKKTIEKLTLAAILILEICNYGCDKKIELPQVIKGSVSDVEYFLKLTGNTPCSWRQNRDFDGDGINDSYVMPAFNNSIIYYTKSREPQPFTDRNIRWYLLKENKNE